MTTPIRKAGSLALLLLASSPLHALDFDVGEFGISFVNRFTIGAAWRIEERDPDLRGCRVLQMVKNRFGGAGGTFFLELNKRGFREVARVSAA